MILLKSYYLIFLLLTLSSTFYCKTINGDKINNEEEVNIVESTNATNAINETNSTNATNETNSTNATNIANSTNTTIAEKTPIEGQTTKNNSNITDNLKENTKEVTIESAVSKNVTQFKEQELKVNESFLILFLITLSVSYKLYKFLL